jgi:hypothetical protein
MNPLFASPAPSRDHYETGLTGEELLPKGKVREFRLWATRPWTAERAIPYILAGGRFDFNTADFVEGHLPKAKQVQDIRDQLIRLRLPDAA